MSVTLYCAQCGRFNIIEADGPYAARCNCGSVTWTLQPPALVGVAYPPESDPPTLDPASVSPEEDP